MAQGRKTAKKTSRGAKKTGRGKSASQKTVGQKTAGRKTVGRKTAGQKTAGQKTAGKKTAGAVAAGSEGEHPTVAMVRGLAEVVEAHSLSELIVDSPDLTLTLRRVISGPENVSSTAGTAGAMTSMPLMTAPAAALPAAGAPVVAAGPAAPAHTPAAEPVPEDNYHVVTSPFVGTFYRRPNPDAAPYAEIGARVEKGAPLCIVEAMKLMNEIEADATGNVVAVLVEDGEAVEYGQALFKIDTV